MKVQPFGNCNIILQFIRQFRQKVNTSLFLFSWYDRLQLGKLRGSQKRKWRFAKVEKQIITAERYKVSEEYYVDVREEVAGTGERDYWLCSRSRDGKIFMCTKRYRGQRQEEAFLSDQVPAYIGRYESSMQ